MKSENKLGTGDVKKLFLSMAFPAIIGQLVSLLYNLVDRIYIGHIPEIGGDALAGVGVTAPIIIIISAFAYLIGAGGAPLASIKMGQGKKEEAEKIMGNAFFSLVILSFAIMVFILIFMDEILYLFGVSDVTYQYAKDYLTIYTLGSTFVMITLGMNSFITAQGFAKIAMLTVSIGAIINIILDPILIFALNMNVRGAALATIISQGISALWVMRFMTGKETNLKLKKENFKLEKNIMSKTIQLGMSPFVMNVTESFIMIAFNTSLLKYVGDSAVGAMTIMSSCMMMLFLPLSGLTQGAQPILSYNFGARNRDRVQKTFKILLIACFGYASTLWALFQLFPGFFARFFTSNPEIIQLASKGLRIYMAGAFAMGVQIACQQTFISMGNARTSLFLAVLRKIILLLPLIYILPRFIEDKFFAIILAEPISDIIASTVTGIVFYFGFREVMSQMTSNEEKS